ncbi:hypothetical protein CRUP_023023 [Coryphaenoides rupestris]|nr:hypothetical protein CRUP_023023 [Coryphaenoides rupestris]
MSSRLSQLWTVGLGPEGDVLRPEEHDDAEQQQLIDDHFLFDKPVSPSAGVRMGRGLARRRRHLVGRGSLTANRARSHGPKQQPLTRVSRCCCCWCVAGTTREQDLPGCGSTRGTTYASSSIAGRGGNI